MLLSPLAPVVSPVPQAEAPRDCPLCPRLVGLREACRAEHPDWWNAPVPAWGDPHAWLAVVGMAPGKQGANRTGRPFTGDFAGDLLYSTLIRFGLARGRFLARPDDGLELAGTAITNAVRCVPPENNPTPGEITTCRTFLSWTLAGFPNLRAVLALGAIAHQSTVRAFGQRVATMPFKHGARYETGPVALFSSYHCSRYNTTTGVLTEAMFVSIFSEIADFMAM